MSRQHNHSQGFTIIELLIATMVFSVILLGATTALFQLERMYYRGIITSKTQTASRTIMAEISQQLQLSQNKFSQAAPITNYTANLTVNAFCINTARYTYVLNAQVEDSAPSGTYVPSQGAPDRGHQIQHALWRDTIGTQDECKPLNLSLSDPSNTSASDAPKGSDGSELLQQNMRLSQLAVSCRDDSLCSVKVGIIYGDDDLLAPDSNDPLGCKTIFGDQWCAASNLSTNVFKRLQ